MIQNKILAINSNDLSFVNPDQLQLDNIRLALLSRMHYLSNPIYSGNELDYSLFYTDECIKIIEKSTTEDKDILIDSLMKSKELMIAIHNNDLSKIEALFDWLMSEQSHKKAFLGTFVGNDGHAFGRHYAKTNDNKLKVSSINKGSRPKPSHQYVFKIVDYQTADIPDYISGDWTNTSKMYEAAQPYPFHGLDQIIGNCGPLCMPILIDFAIANFQNPNIQDHFEFQQARLIDCLNLFAHVAKNNISSEDLLMHERSKRVRFILKFYNDSCLAPSQLQEPINKAFNDDQSPFFLDPKTLMGFSFADDKILFRLQDITSAFEELPTAIAAIRAMHQAVFGEINSDNFDAKVNTIIQHTAHSNSLQRAYLSWLVDKYTPQSRSDIKKLVQHLDSDNTNLKIVCAHILQDLIFNKNIREICVTETDAVTFLVAGLNSGNASLAITCAYSLGLIAVDEAYAVFVANEPNAIHFLVEGLNSDHNEIVLSCAKNILNLARYHTENNIKIANEPNSIKYLVAGLKSDRAEIVTTCAHALRKLGSYHPELRTLIANEPHAITSLIDGLNNSDADIKLTCAETLELLTLSPENKILIATENNAIASLVAGLKSEDKLLNFACTQTLRNLSSNTDNQRTIANEPESISLLVAGLNSNNNDDVIAYAQTLLRLSFHPDNQIIIANEPNAIKHLISGLNSDNDKLVTICAQTLSNLASPIENKRTIANEPNAIKYLVAGLDSYNDEIVIACAHVLNNLATQTQLNQALIGKEDNAISYLIDALRSDNQEVKFACTLALRNLATLPDNRLLISNNPTAIHFFFDGLSSKKADHKRACDQMFMRLDDYAIRCSD
jgi:hypothetical protein